MCWRVVNTMKSVGEFSIKHVIIKKYQDTTNKRNTI